jgi:hypothetical protein
MPGILARIKPPRFPNRTFLLQRFGAKVTAALIALRLSVARSIVVRKRAAAKLSFRTARFSPAQFT